MWQLLNTCKLDVTYNVYLKSTLYVSAKFKSHENECLEKLVSKRTNDNLNKCKSNI